MAIKVDRFCFTTEHTSEKAISHVKIKKISVAHRISVPSCALKNDVTFHAVSCKRRVLLRATMGSSEFFPMTTVYLANLSCLIASEEDGE